jgi:hypothetical protein
MTTRTRARQILPAAAFAALAVWLVLGPVRAGSQDPPVVAGAPAASTANAAKRAAPPALRVNPVAAYLPQQGLRHEPVYKIRNVGGPVRLRVRAVELDPSTGAALPGGSAAGWVKKIKAPRRELEPGERARAKLRIRVPAGEPETRRLGIVFRTKSPQRSGVKMKVQLIASLYVTPR